MNVSDLSLKDLAYVLAVARHESFSGAAQACAVSQPALSKQVKNLETQLGTQLFERNKRHVALTEAGQAFVAQANTVLDEAVKLIALSQPQQEALSGRFQLGAIASVCPYLLPYFVGALKTDFPHLQLMIKEGLTANLLADLKQGRLDALIAAPTFEDEALASVPLFFEPFLLASPAEVSGGVAVQATSPDETIDVSDIDPGKLLLLEDGHCLKEQTMALCALQEQGVTSASFKATSLETLLQMTVGGLGVAIIPVLAKPEGSRLSRNLRFQAFKNPDHGRTLALYYRKTYPRQDNIQALARFITQHLPGTVQALV